MMHRRNDMDTVTEKAEARSPVATEVVTTVTDRSLPVAAFRISRADLLLGPHIQVDHSHHTTRSRAVMAVAEVEVSVSIKRWVQRQAEFVRPRVVCWPRELRSHA